MVSLGAMQRALQGALIAGGGATLLQMLLARRLARPGSAALALATFVGLFRVLEDHEETEYGDKETANGVSSPRAAAIAAAAALAVLDPTRRGLVVSLACAEAAIVLGKKIPRIHDLPHVELLVGAVVYTQLVYTWIFRPDLYAPSQLAALDRFTLRPKDVATAMREQFPSRQLASRCAVWHPNEPSCATYHVHNFCEGLPQLMRLYLPIFMVTAFGLKWTRWVHGPRPSLQQTMLQFLRTTVSLKLSSQLGVVSSCYLPVADHRLATYFGGVFTTLCLLAENEKRRAGSVKTVAIYVLCTSGTWTARALGLSPRSRTAWQLALVAGAFAVLFQQPTKTQSLQLLTMLYGRRVRQQPDITTTSTQPSAKQKSDPDQPTQTTVV